MEERNKKIIEMFKSGMTKKKISEELILRYHQVDGVIKTQTDYKRYKSIKWIDEEVQFLRDNFPKYHGKYCAEQLGRSFYATHKKAASLGLVSEWEHECLDKDGYKHTYISRRNKPREHRLIIEEYLGRKLTSNEVVHHIDGNRINNDLGNLQVMTRAEHMNHHRSDITHTKI